jgi:NAD dependent epimerase/dehydratase family enzyme
MQVDELTGAVNIVSPHPVTQTVFSKLLAKVLHRPCLLKIPRCLILGEKMRALLLPSLEVYPDKLQKSGFAFTYTTLEQTLKHELFK